MMKEHKKLERLMLFSEVAEHLSVTAAAEKLNISRGHLSTQIRRLEQDMEMVLLIRSTRSVRLTPEGERVLTGMNKIRHDLLELERSAEHEGNIVAGRIKITAPAGFTERFLFDIFSKFKQNEDLITIGAYQMGSDPLLDQAILMMPQMTSFLQQSHQKAEPFKESLQQFVQAMQPPAPPAKVNPRAAGGVKR